MKIQLDTEKKTIKLESSENLNELLTLLENILPNGLWKEYTLITNNTITWTNPIVINNPYRIYPTYPTYPWITYDASSNACITSGVYNVEL